MAGKFSARRSSLVDLFPFVQIGEPILVEETIGFDAEDEEIYDRDLFSSFESLHQKKFADERGSLDLLLLPPSTKAFSRSERAKKYQIFKTNLNEIARLNAEETGTAFYGITQFTDLTRSFSSLTLPFRLVSFVTM